MTSASSPAKNSPDSGSGQSFREALSPVEQQLTASGANGLHTVSGRVIEADGNHIPGASVYFSATQSSSNAWRRPDLPPTSSQPAAADGKFQVTWANPTGPARLELHAPGFIPRTFRIEGARPNGHETNLGDLILSKGFPLEGVLLDAAGRPCSDQTILASKWLDTIPEAHLRHKLEVMSDSQGNFSFGHLEPGNYSLKVVDQVLAGQAVAHLGSGFAAQHYVLRMLPLLESQRIAGVVFSPDGHMADGAQIQAVDIHNTRVTTTSNARGEFTLINTKELTSLVRISAKSTGSDLSPHGDSVAWGEQSLVLTLQETASLVLRVTSENPESPLGAFGLRLLRVEGHSLAPLRFTDEPVVEHMGMHLDGELQVSGLLAGTYYLQVVPGLDSQVAPSDFMLVQVDRSLVQPIHVRLAPLAKGIVRVFDESGEPLQGCQMKLYLAHRDEDGLEVDAQAADEWTVSTSDDKRLIATEGPTDHTGSWQMSGPASTPLVLQILGPACKPAFIRIPDLAQVGEITHKAQTPATLEISVLNDGVLEAFAQSSIATPQLRLTSSSDGPLTLAPVILETHVGPGTTSHALSAGTLTPILLLADSKIPLAPITLQSGQTNQLVIDLSQWAPARMNGILEIGGKPQPLTELRLNHLTRNLASTKSKWRAISLTTDPLGQFEFTGLPGQYRVTVPGHSKGVSDVLATPVVLDLAPGQHAEQTFSIALGGITVHFVDQQGTPLSNVRGVRMLRSLDSSLIGELPPSDKHGVVRLADCEEGTVQFVGLPMSLAEPKARINFAMKAGSLEAIDLLVFSLGTATVARNGMTEMTITMPDIYFDEPESKD